MKSRYIVLGRVTKQSGTVSSVTTHCNGTASVVAPVVLPSSGPIDVEFVKESIDGSFGRNAPHGVTHSKLEFKVNDPGSSYWSAGNNGSTFLRTDYSYAGQNQHENLIFMSERAKWAPFGDSLFKDPPGWTIVKQAPNEQVLIEDCYVKAQQLNADVLLNIVEANQMWPSIKSLAACLPLLKDKWATIRKLIRTTSGAYLAWKFGVSPVLQDASNIWRYLPKLGSDLQRHKDGKSSRASRNVTLSASHLDISEQRYPIGQHYYGIEFKGKVTLPPSLRYVLVVKPKVKYYTDIARALAVCMDRFATGPATLAWELVPFSFIADWFVDIRGLCRLLDDQLRSPPYEVLSFTRSLKYEILSEGHLRKTNPCNGSDASSWDMGKCSFKHYDRSLVPPGYSSPQWNPRFGKNQAGITAALIGQKLSAAKWFKV